MSFIAPASAEAALHIARNLREADKQECDALLALPPELVLTDAAVSGRPVWTFHTPAGEPLGIFGVDPVGDGMMGTIWMCSTDDLKKHTREFIRTSSLVIDKLHDDFPILTNLVDARNTLHHRWLKWMGFAFLRRVDKWGARSVPFIEFARIKPCASE